MRRPLWIGAGVASVSALLAILAAWWLWAELHRPHAGWQGEAAVVKLERGMPAGAMLVRLHEAGVIRRPGVVRRWLAWSGQAAELHAGEYRFDRPRSAVEVVDMLRRGAVVLHPVTIPEGLMIPEVARRLADEGFGEFTVLVAAFSDPASIRAFDPDAPDLEGYLFPETYHFPSGEPPEAIADAMVARFLDEVGADYPGRAEQAGLTVRQAVTLASMIEEETSVPDERARISRVFHNRLDRGMKMQCDPTVIYALRREGREVGRLTYRDLEYESPWNTYHAAGLPPGPISSPGKASLHAAVDPAPGRDLYFVASPDGGHKFSPDLDGHLRAVREWRAYVRSSR